MSDESESPLIATPNPSPPAPITWLEFCDQLNREQGPCVCGRPECASFCQCPKCRSYDLRVRLLRHSPVLEVACLHCRLLITRVAVERGVEPSRIIIAQA